MAKVKCMKDLVDEDVVDTATTLIMLMAWKLLQLFSLYVVVVSTRAS